jgi:SAM-dependent methyltransferase
LGRVGRYDVTEPSSFFRRQGERRLASRFPAMPLAFGGLDMNTGWETQGFADGTWDLVYGVNVLHVATNLAATLARIGSRLASDGLLVAGEAMRLAPGVPLAAELIFSILEGFTQVELDPVLRPEPGFLSPESWRRSLASAGFRAVRVEPDLAAIAPLFPRFGVGVMLAAKGDPPCPA